MVTCDQQEKVSSSQKVFPWLFLEIRNVIRRYAELNRLLVGSGLIPLNLELPQDDRTVCCANKIVYDGAFKCVHQESEEAVWALGCSLVEPVHLFFLLNGHI